MSIPVPFGQYVPGSSAIHRLDPRVKLGLVVVYTAVLFGANGWWGLATASVAAIAALLLSGVPPRLALRGLKPVAWLLLFTLAANSLRLDTPDAIVQIGRLGVDSVGLRTGLFFSVRIIALVVGTSLLTLTTSPVALTDALTRVMAPLRVLRVPVDDIAMMFSIALRFIPTTAEEAEKIIVAQTARGAVFDQGGPIKRARAWVPVLVPLFVNLFRRADDLALAMESRCYTGERRTRLHQPVMRAVDWMVLSTGLVAGVAAVVFL
jgi:energy-coupling factor transport system permease protein